MPAISQSMPGPVAARPVARWTTDGVPADQRLDFWTGAICDAYLRLECSSSTPNGFEGLIESVEAGGLIFTRMQASSQVIRNLPSEPGGCKDAFYLVTDRRAHWTLKQGGHLRQLRAGDLALIDAREPYQVLFQDGTTIATVELPLCWMRAHLSMADSAGARTIPRDTGWARVLSSLCVELSNSLELVRQVPETWMADQLGALLAAATEPAGENRDSRACRELKARTEQLLARQLDDPGLTATAVAQALGVSVRSLHRTFAASGTSFATTLRRERLTQAMRLLQRPNMAGLSVAEIGLRCGFPDPSHFSREFRRHCGMPPGQWRQRPPDA